MKYGILDLDDSRNPFHAWTLVYLPYCDGSVFSGHRAPVYDGKPTYHHGIQNLSAAISVIRSWTPEPESIAIAGSSAGAYGAFAAYRRMRALYPGVSILIISSSGIGLQNHEDRTSVEQRLENWGLADSLSHSCERCGEQYTYGWDEALTQDARLRVAVIDHVRDGVLSFFLNMRPEVLQELWDDVTGEIHRNHRDRFKRLLLPGQGHVVLSSPSFYHSRGDLPSIADWIRAAISGSSGWRDLAQRRE